MGHGAVTFNRAVSSFAAILHIGKTYSVTADAPVPLALHFVGAAGIAISIVFLGWRLVPVAGWFSCAANPPVWSLFTQQV